MRIRLQGAPDKFENAGMISRHHASLSPVLRTLVSAPRVRRCSLFALYNLKTNENEDELFITP